MAASVKILFLIDSLMTGGAERQLVELATRLDTRYYMIAVWCLHHAREHWNAPFVQRLEAAGVRVGTLGLSRERGCRSENDRAIERLITQLQPSIVHTFNYQDAMAARRVQRRFHKHTRLIVGSFIGRLPFKQKIQEVWFRLASDAVVCNSAAIAQQLVWLGVPRRRLRVIANGVDADRWLPRNTWGDKSSHGRRFVMLGRIAREKQPQLIVEAFHNLRRSGRLPTGVECRIVGGASDRSGQKVKEDLLAQITRYKLHEVISVRGATDCPERELHAADFSILPSRYEGMPNAVLESLAAGRPAIVSQAANACELVEQGVTGWVYPTHRMDKLAELISQAAALPTDQLMIMREACIERARGFSMTAMVEAYESLYAEVLSRPSRYW